MGLTKLCNYVCIRFMSTSCENAEDTGMEIKQASWNYERNTKHAISPTNT